MRPEVRQLYKALLYMGREYPEGSGGYAKFAVMLKRAFRGAVVRDEDDLQKALEKGEFVKKGTFDPQWGTPCVCE